MIALIAKVETRKMGRENGEGTLQKIFKSGQWTRKAGNESMPKYRKAWSAYPETVQERAFVMAPLLIRNMPTPNSKTRHNGNQLRGCSGSVSGTSRRDIVLIRRSENSVIHGLRRMAHDRSGNVRYRQMIRPINQLVDK